MRPRHIYIPLIVGALTPSLVVLALEMYGQKRPAGLPPPGSLWGAVYLAALTLIPFAALIPATKAFSARLTGWRLECVFWGGLVAVTAFTVFGHAAVWWPLYFRGYRMSSTAVIAFLFIPFYSLGALAVGLLVGYVISLVAYVFPRGGSPWSS